jgi:hypothetical protein
MAGLNRVSVVWQGWPGSPGVSQFYLDNVPAQSSIDAIRAFFFSQAGILPAGLTINVPGSGDIVEDVSGQLAGTWSVGTTPATVTGTGAGVYAGNAGAVVHWLTTTVALKRRLRGRTFLVPLVSSAYDASGSLSTAALGSLQNNAAAMVTTMAGNMVVWHRPVIQKGTGAILRPGSSGDVTAARVPDLAVSLRSRRI